MNRNKEILKDHIREGKKLIPPFLRVGNFKDVSYVQKIIPELIWIALLNKKFGIKYGSELTLEFIRAASSIRPESFFFSFISSYEVFTNEDHKKLLLELEKKDILSVIQDGLTDFLGLYPLCPLSFLVQNRSGVKSNLDEVKNLLEDLYDKASPTATFMMCNVIYSLLVMDRLKIVEGCAIARLPELESYPDTEISRRIASNIRATMNIFMQEPFYNSSTLWNGYFWNRGIELEPCRL